MISNLMRDKCQRQTKRSTHTALGDTVTWGDSVSYFCRKKPVDVVTKTAYMQKNTEVTDVFVFRGSLSFNLDRHRIIHGGYIYTLVESGFYIKGMTTVKTKRGDAI